MWYIEKICSLSKEPHAVAKEELCVYYDALFRRENDIYVVLRNSKTGRIARLTGEAGKLLDFDMDLDKYNPYGYFRKQAGSCMLVVIDELSMQFLEYVDKVESKFAIRDGVIQPLVWSYRLSFWYWDRERTVLNINSRYDTTFYALTLFQVICYMNRGWVGDKFYLRDTDECICEVSFSDIHKARALIAKAAAMGYDPVGKLLSIHEDASIRQQ